jgi:signal transduction histidine kinase/HAMP domain-containing protein
MAVVPSFGLICYTAKKHRDLAASQVKISALGAARAIAAEQDRVIENAHQFLVTLARIPQIRGIDNAACHQVLAGLLEPIYADLIVADRKGHSLCAALSPATSVASPNGAHFRRTLETYGFSVGDLRDHPRAGKTVLDIGYPVSTSPGYVEAVVSAALDLSWITRLTVDRHIQPGMTFTLVNENGAVLLRHPDASHLKEKRIFSESVDSRNFLHEAEQTAEVEGADDIERLFAFRRLRYPINGQTVYASIDIPVNVAFAEARRILVVDLMILGLLSTIALSAAWFGADMFVLRRIRDIIAATKQVATGTLTARTSLPYGNSELGHLARAFDDLAHALETREAEVVHATKQIQTQRQQQRALYDLNRGITSTLDLGNVLKTLLDHVSALYPHCVVTVNWINNQTGALEPLTKSRLNESDTLPSDLARLQSLPGVVLKQQSPVAISNVQIDPRTTDHDFFRRHRLFSYLGLPLLAKHDILGVLSFYSKEEREFSQEEMKFINTLTHEAAIAIYNSRLFAQTQEQATELEKSNRIKDEFLSVMSHELRTPLNIIMNYCEVLKMGTFGELTPDQTSGLDKISAQSEHLLSLINGILEITKIEAGTLTMLKEPVDLVAFMSESQSDYVTPTDGELAVKWDYPSDLPTIITDRMKLKQILLNLVNNAIKFTDHGLVLVSVRVVEQGQMIEIQVADTGAGIPNDQLDCIFDKFRQLDSAATRDHSGAGLGLYIVKTFVDLFAGKIEVQSKLGEGSEFTVRLPIQRDHSESSIVHRSSNPFERYSDLENNY